MAATVVGLPQPTKAVLATNIPYLEVYWWIWRRKRDGSNILSDRRDSFEVGVRRRVGAFYLLKQRCLAGIVETEEKNRVLWGLLDLSWWLRRLECAPSLLVAWRYMDLKR
jgi:hypothetical protein